MSLYVDMIGLAWSLMLLGAALWYLFKLVRVVYTCFKEQF